MEINELALLAGLLQHKLNAFRNCLLRYWAGIWYQMLLIVVIFLLFCFLKCLVILFSFNIHVQKTHRTSDLGIYLYNITNLFHGNRPCQAVTSTIMTDFQAVPK